MPLGYQVVFRAEGDRVLAPDDGRRRAWASALLEHGRPHGLFGFGLGDTHGHAVLACSRGAVSGFVHDLRLSLGLWLAEGGRETSPRWTVLAGTRGCGRLASGAGAVRGPASSPVAPRRARTHPRGGDSVVTTSAWARSPSFRQAPRGPAG